MNSICFPNLQTDVKTNGETAWIEQGDSLLDQPNKHGKCIITPGTAIAPMRINFTPKKRLPGEPWDNSYVYHKNAYSPAITWVYSVCVLFLTQQDLDNCHAFEMDWQKNDSTRIHNLGWQFLFKTGFRVWDRNKGWQLTNLPLDVTKFEPGKLIRINALFSHDNTHVVYEGISVNNKYYPLTQIYQSIVQPQSLYVDNAVQVDSDGQGSQIKYELHECNLSGF